VCAIVGDFNGTCLLDGTRRGSRGCLCGAVAGVSCAEGALGLAVWPLGRPVPASGGSAIGPGGASGELHCDSWHLTERRHVAGGDTRVR